MSLLLETDALLWWLSGDHLDDAAANAIADPGTTVMVSAVSIWEAAIKAARGKLVVPESLADVVGVEGFEPLPITFDHAERAGRLPEHHRDPFDRMLVAQAQAERLTIVTRDPAFDAYEVGLLRC